MSVDEAMSADIVQVAPTDVILEAAKLMAKKRIGSLLVYDGDRPVGILTERDIVDKVVAKGIDCHRTYVRDIMTNHLIMIDVGASLTEANMKMKEHHIRRLPVTRQDKIVGIVTVRDVAERLPYSIARQIHAVESSEYYPAGLARFYHE